MLTDGALRYLRSLRVDSAAECQVSVIPLGGIFWSDELPHGSGLIALPAVDKALVYRLFGIRQRIWTGDILSDSDQAFWDNAKVLAPECPIFVRLAPSPEERLMQRNAEMAADDFLSALASEADEFVTKADGTFSATIDLTKKDPDKSGNES